MKRILVAGATGVFGRLLTRHLLERTDAHLVLAARNIERVRDLASTLAHNERLQTRAVDLTRPAQVLEAAKDCFAIACTAGPFQAFDPKLPMRVAAEGIHWVDIADDADWVIPILRGTGGPGTIVPGASVVPCLSGVLARYLLDQMTAPEQARITLFIGNRNNKGAGAIASALVSDFARPVNVQLPFGTWKAWRFASPDDQLLAEELELSAEFRVAFELTLTNWMVAALQPVSRTLAPPARARLARRLSLMSKPLNRFGTPRGCIQVELFDNEGGHACAALVSAGQRLAILPCFVTLRALMDGTLRAHGRVHPATWMSPEQWLQTLSELGLKLFSGAGQVVA